MGSKRRHDDDEEVSLKKRRKREDSDGEIAASLVTPDKKKRKSKGHELETNGQSNGEVPFTLNKDEEIVFLIKKPKNLSLEDLQEKLSLKAKVKPRTKTFRLDSGKNYTMNVAPCETIMYHVPAADDGNLVAGNRIAGVVTITEDQPKGEEGDFMIHEDFLEDPPADIKMPFVIKPIKREPELVLDGLKQRLHAYGCAPTESEEAPRKEKKAKRKSKRADDDE